MTSAPGRSPSRSNAARNSAGGLNAPFAATLWIQSRCTAPGTAPPRRARTRSPKYSSSVRTSKIRTSLRPSRSTTYSLEAKISSRGAAANALGVTGSTAAVSSAPAQLQSAVEDAHAPMSHVLGDPRRARRAHPGVVLVKDQRLGAGDAERREDPFELRARPRASRSRSYSSSETETDRSAAPLLDDRRDSRPPDAYRSAPRSHRRDAHGASARRLVSRFAVSRFDLAALQPSFPHILYIGGVTTVRSPWPAPPRRPPP